MLGFSCVDYSGASGNRARKGPVNKDSFCQECTDQGKLMDFGNRQEKVFTSAEVINDLFLGVTSVFCRLLCIPAGDSPTMFRVPQWANMSTAPSDRFWLVNVLSREASLRYLAFNAVDVGSAHGGGGGSSSSSSSSNVFVVTSSSIFFSKVDQGSVWHGIC